MQKKFKILLIYNLFFMAFLITVNKIVLHQMDADAALAGVWAWVYLAWLLVAFSIHDLALGHILGVEGVFVRPAIRKIKEALPWLLQKRN